MPTMYPDSLPKPLEEYLRGEAKVFEAFKNQLSEDWIVYHGVNWHIPSDKHSKQRDAETDFILTHPQYGILIIEVKGGLHIRFSADQGKWFSTDYQLDVHEIQDPYFQAKQNKYNVINELLKIEELSYYNKSSLDDKVNIGYGVIFPDVTVVNGTLPVEANADITFTNNQLNQIEKNIIALCDYYARGKQHSSALSMQAHLGLRNLLAPSFTIDRRLSTWFDDEEKRIIELDDEQYNLLNYIRYVKRASIYGCAGSGKTLIAIRKAELLSQEEQAVLLVCFNNILGKHLQKHFIADRNVVAGSFYETLCSELHIPLTYDDTFIKIKLMEDHPGYFDAILIDEAQDFTQTQLEIIKLLWKDDGLLYYFWDDNQQVMKRDVNIAFDKDAIPITLTTNHRNTAKIFSAVKLHFHKDISIDHKGVEGRNVLVWPSYKHKNTTALFVKLREILFGLIEVERIEPKDITILTFKSKMKSHLNDFTSIYPLDLFSDDPNPKGVRIETVRRFKGMESKVVIVTEMDDESSMQSPILFGDMCYVSFSRAVHHLIILPPDNVKM